MSAKNSKVKAAGIAHATRGRAKVFVNKKKVVKRGKVKAEVDEG
jgi:hypothetical protein